MQKAIEKTRGVVFLSATFAKRPDNMPLYAKKTSIRDANLTDEGLIQAISLGGVALQEILASQLVAEGQMIRRERSFEGVEVNYITLDEKEREHKTISDKITEIIRDIIDFQKIHVGKQVKQLDDEAVAEGKQMELTEGTSKAGVDNLPYFSKVFNIINQMLFSIKAEAVAERALDRLKEGKKPVIAFSSTMGSFIEQMENEHGMPVSDGDVIVANFSIVLQKGLEGVLRYTETDFLGGKTFLTFDITTFPKDAQKEYYRISENIKRISTGISISPIDIIIEKIEQAGYSVAEVTGRKYKIQSGSKPEQDKNEKDADSSKQYTGLVLARKRENTNDAFRKFNNNEVDVLLINQSGSTGASAHAIATPKVPKEQVKQRVMIVLQAELDISTEVQKRGRINRTGQLHKPIYDYVNSAIPAEKRLMMMLQKKLKSLDANTTSNQKSSTKILDVPDFLNKYGDKIVYDYLNENIEINKLLDSPLDGTGQEGASHKVSGRVAVLSTDMQQSFYNEITERYNEYVNYLKQANEYDLEVEAMDLQAETVSLRPVIIGKGGQSAFGDDSVLETVMANVLKKPFTKTELNAMLNEALQGKQPEQLQQQFLDEFKAFHTTQLELEIRENDTHYRKQIDEIPNEKKFQKYLKEDGEEAYQAAVSKRKDELENERIAAEANIRKPYIQREQSITHIAKRFYIGRLLNYPISTWVAKPPFLLSS